MKVEKNLGGRPPIYNWSGWFKRKKFTLKRGKDFHCMTHAMAQRIRTQAAKEGHKVSIVFKEDALVVTMKGRNGKP